MRLIDADALKNEFEEDGHLSGYIEEFIDSSPTIKEEPVKHGKWLKRKGYYDEYYDYVEPVECSVCGYVLEMYENFCPNCGARMEVK